MAYKKKIYGGYNNGYNRREERFLPLLRSMTDVQRCVQDVVNAFSRSGAAVKNGELLRVMPLQFENAAVCSINGKLHFWNGRYYEEMTKEDFYKFLLRFMDNCNVQPEAFNSLQLIQEACMSVAMSKRVRVDANKFVFNNGVYDVQTKEFERGFSPDVIQINACDYDYDVQEPVIWRKFLNEVLPDKYSQDTLQMFLGATLLGRKEAKIEKMLVLYGKGANGKSVIFETVKGVLGEESVSGFGVDELVNDNDKKRNIADMNGKRLNYCSEIRSFLGKDMYDDALKVLISGEPIVARPMYGNNFHSRDLPLMMCNTNWDMEQIKMSPALRRRILQLRFDTVIPQGLQDRRLHIRLREEYAGIFSWMVEGMEKLRGNEYKFPDEEALPSSKEEHWERKKLLGATLWDVVLSFLTNNKYNYKSYGRRTSKFSVKLTWLLAGVKTHAKECGFVISEKMTTNSLNDVLVKHGCAITKSGGCRYAVLWATPEDVKAFHERRKKGETEIMSNE